ncbi:MAG: hypothetical protein IPP20_04255 [Gemmatimonadetes bacterium]|nr:hypothetical protein [Gemmatimonadota bacterium]
MSDAERAQIHNQDQSGQQAWSRCGVSVTLSGQLPVTIFTGEKFDKAMAVIVPRDAQHLLALYAFAVSTEFSTQVRAIDQKPIVANGTL